MINYFDPQFYEYQALVFLANKFGIGIKANYKIPDYSIPLQSRNEIDGLLEKDDQQIAIEVKSFPLDYESIGEISNKLSKLGFKEQIIIAPNFLTGKNGNNHVRLIKFSPNTKIINDFYRTWKPVFNPLIMVKIVSGKHHFRYRLTKRGSQKQHRYLNQVDKKINSVDKIKVELTKRLPKNNQPIKLLWSVSSFVNPKDLFFKNRPLIGNKNNLLAFDIDGQKAHGAFMPCEIESITGLCPHCLFFSKLEVKKLQKLLPQVGIKNIGTYFSGRSGFHIYGESDKEYSAEKLKKELFKNKIKNDNTVTFNQKSLIGFPESLNAISGYQLVEVNNLDTFIPKKYG